MSEYDIENKRYAVIVFLPRKEEDDIDLIPYSWVEKQENAFYCRYPDSKKDLKKRDKYLEEFSDAKLTWPLCHIEIITTTNTLEQGKRRLKRAETTLAVSTDDGKNSNAENIIQLSNNDLNAEFNDLQPMNSVSSLTISSDINLKNITKKQKKSRAVNTDLEHLTDNVEKSIDLLKPYIDLKFKELQDSIFKKLDAMKASMAYDLKREVTELKNQIIIAQSTNRTPNQSLTQAMEPYNQTLPFEDLENFTKFDENLASLPEERQKLIELYKVLIYGEESDIKCIHKTLSATLSPKVQILYSGTGKKFKGVGKLNFSATNTYKCLRDAIEEKFGDSSKTKTLLTKTGVCLANAGDRDGGRRNRVSVTK